MLLSYATVSQSKLDSTLIHLNDVPISVTCNYVKYDNFVSPCLWTLSCLLKHCLQWVPVFHQYWLICMLFVLICSDHFTSLPIACHFDSLMSISCLSGSDYTIALLLCKGIMDVSAQFLMENSEVIIKNKPYMYPPLTASILLLTKVHKFEVVRTDKWVTSVLYLVVRIISHSIVLPGLWRYWQTKEMCVRFSPQ